MSVKKEYIFCLYAHEIGDSVILDHYDDLEKLINYIRNNILLSFEEEFSSEGKKLTYSNTEIENIVNDIRETFSDPTKSHWSHYLKGHMRQLIIDTKGIIIDSICKRTTQNRSYRRNSIRRNNVSV